MACTRVFGSERIHFHYGLEKARCANEAIEARTELSDFA